MSKVIAQLILSVTTMVGRAVFNAYTQALQNAKGKGGAAAAANAGLKGMGGIARGKMGADEALKILNMEKPNLNKVLLEAQYKKFFENNNPDKGGSFYLQSKIFRAKEALDYELAPKSPPPSSAPPPSSTDEAKKDSSNSSSSRSSSSSSSSSNGRSRR